ncbi:protein translocase subunit SecF [Parasphingorhabdus sp.]|uniref:protein translocase subunit SecF n=1 Tax=Parasphingorhabdus sp. TaxID=2709688 RepID=UPI002F94FA3D
MKLLKLVPDTTNIRFLKWRNIAIAISILLTIGSMVLVAQRGLNFGVDFVGGQMIRTTFTQSAEAPISDLREKVSDLGYGDPIIQRFGEANEVSIRMKLPDGASETPDLANQMASEITGMMQETYPGVRIDGVDSVSGKVSAELMSKGIWSLVGAMVAIALYIWIRFEWQFGVGALFALFHDIAMTFGFFALTQLEFDLNIVAALLTIIGYSLNDTIVTYDRIRENLMKYRKMEIIPLLDLSINETLARTVMTSMTTIIALSALLIWGPDTIFGFAAAMTLGVVVGTYSTVFMAGPILVWLKVGPDSFVPADRADKKAERVGGPEEVG